MCVLDCNCILCLVCCCCRSLCPTIYGHEVSLLLVQSSFTFTPQYQLSSRLNKLLLLLTCYRVMIVLFQLVKAGLALGLFGGTHKFLDDKVFSQVAFQRITLVCKLCICLICTNNNNAFICSINDKQLMLLLLCLQFG